MKNEVQNSEKEVMAPSARFKNLVVREFEQNAGEIKLNQHMERMLQSYFIKLDSVLKENETKRLQKSEQYRDALEFSWKNVNMEKMAQDCIAFAMVGLDPMQPNQVFLIPYKNNHSGKFDIGFMPGYRGLELKAKKFGVDVPSDVVIELIYKNDVFKIIKKDQNNRVENYTLSVENPFDRGEIIGGFIYFNYESQPAKNKIRVMSREDILKRKPKYASPEFWGGEKDEYKDGKKTGKKETVDGWFEEMCIKTLSRAAWNSITIDSEKINNHVMQVLEIERETIQRAETVDVDHEVLNQKTIEAKETIAPVFNPLAEAKEYEGELKQSEPIEVIAFPETK